MKRKLAAIGVILAAVLLWRFETHAQTGAVFYFSPAVGTTVTNCGTPASGSFPLCGVATGWYVWSGTAWVQLGTATSSAGLTGIIVCNVSGTGCSAAQTGPVVTLDIPKSATTTVTVSAPTATATTTVN
jgi:hypothetical protein